MYKHSVNYPCNSWLLGLEDCCDGTTTSLFFNIGCGDESIGNLGTHVNISGTCYKILEYSQILVSAPYLSPSNFHNSCDCSEDVTPCPTLTASFTPTNSKTPTQTPTNSNTPTNSFTPTPTNTKTQTKTPTQTPTPTTTPTQSIILVEALACCNTVFGEQIIESFVLDNYVPNQDLETFSVPSYPSTCWQVLTYSVVIPPGAIVETATFSIN